MFQEPPAVNLKKFTLERDLSELYDSKKHIEELSGKIRERANSGAVFNTSSSNNMISSVSVFIGEERKKVERKFSLTLRQGRFLYNLPFPTADFLSILSIMEKVKIN